MPRRRGLRRSAAPATSLALVLSILIAFVALLSPAAADQAAPAGAEASTETLTNEAAPEAAAKPGAIRKAERQLRHAERQAEKAEGTATEATETGASGTARGSTGASSKATRRADRATRREGTATVKGAAPAVSAPATNKKREHEEQRRAREEQRRLREEARRTSGHETKKEKQARVEREVAEATLGSQGAAGGQGAGFAAATSAAGGLAPAATPEAKSAAANGTGADAVRAAKSARSPARSRRHGARSPKGAGAALPVAASGTPESGTAGTTGAATRRAHRAAPRHHAAATRSTPLVTSVTRIIGVIPTAVWLLIGVLALAAMAFAASSRFAERRARRLEQQRRALLEDVGLLQAALLPELPSRLGAVSTTAAYRPASGPGAGGDFYDVFALPEGLVAVLVGDVSGHGRDALPHTTLLRYTLRTYLEAGLTPREALRAAAPALERQLGGSFATVVLATYDPRARLLTYACAGHPHPLLTGLDPDLAIIASSAPPIGAGRPTGTRQTVVSVPGEALAAFYTDGLIEARVEGELFGQRRLAVQLEQLGSPGATADGLLDRVAAQTDHRPDDMAACVLGISGGEQRPRIVSEQIELDGREAGHARTSRFLAAAGIQQAEIDRVLSAARAIAADHGSALLTIDKSEGAPRLTLTHDNVAPLRARALARTQEVAL